MGDTTTPDNTASDQQHQEIAAPSNNNKDLPGITTKDQEPGSSPEDEPENNVPDDPRCQFRSGEQFIFSEESLFSHMNGIVKH